MKLPFTALLLTAAVLGPNGVHAQAETRRLRKVVDEAIDFTRDVDIARNESFAAGAGSVRGSTGAVYFRSNAEDLDGLLHPKDEDEIPTFADELKRLEETNGYVGLDDEVMVLHNLLLKAAGAKKELEEALELTAVNQHEMESIFTDHDDLAEDVLTAFDHVEEENAKLGEEVVRFLQDHIVEEEDGTFRYKSSTPDPVEEMKTHRRRLEEGRQARWEKYFSERELLPKKLREHRAFLRRHLSEDLSEDCDEPRCYSEVLESYETELEDIVVVLEDEFHPLMNVMDKLSTAVGKVRKAAGTVGTLVVIFKVLKRIPGLFGVIFGSAFGIFNTLDSGADPVEKAVDDFEDYVLGIWENTAGAALTMIYAFEALFSKSVALFSFAADAPYIPAIPGLMRGLLGIDVAQFNNGVQTVEEHVTEVVGKLRSLMSAFASDIFLSFHTKAEDFIDAMDEIGKFMSTFDFVEKAYNHEIELPFGMPRTLMSRKLGRASCAPHANKYTRADQYSGAKQFQLVPPWNVACKETCPSTFDALSGGKRCRKKCSSYGLNKHLVFGIQDGCLRQFREKPLRSLKAIQKCKNKIGSSWYRNFPTDRCRQRCYNWLGAGSFFQEFYGKCSLTCPSGLENHPTFTGKACKIPGSAKFERTKLGASCGQYTNNGQLDVYLKATGGCYENCRSNEHNFRAIFFCVSKDRLKISVKDIVEFVANVLDKISKIPGVGLVMDLIDKALEKIFGFLQELLPDNIGFPEFDLGIDADFLDFGGLTTAFDNLNLPQIQLQDIVGNTISSLASKMQETPLGQIASCATDVECLQNATGLGDLESKLEDLSSSMEAVAEKLSSVFEHDTSELISCAGETITQNVSCTEVFSLFGVEDEECTIELPSCQLNTTGLESALSEVADLFVDDSNDTDTRHRSLGGFGKFFGSLWPKGTFVPMLPFFLDPYFVFSGLKKPTYRLRTNFVGDIVYPKQQIGFHSQFRFPLVRLNIGLYKSDCGKVKFAFEPTIGTEFLFGFTHSFKSMLKKAIDLEQAFGPRSVTGTPADEVPWIKTPYCYDKVNKNICKPDQMKGKCKRACEADELLNKRSIWSKQSCNRFALGDLLKQLKEGKELSKSDKKTGKKCIEHWFDIRQRVMKKTDVTAGKVGSMRKWSGKTATSYPLKAGPPIWHRQDQKDEIYNGPQIGVGLVAYDMRTRTELGPTVWFCPHCDEPGKPVVSDLGDINPMQFKKPRTIADTSVHLKVATQFSFGVVSLQSGKDDEGNKKKFATVVKGVWAKDDPNCD